MNQTPATYCLPVWLGHTNAEQPVLSCSAAAPTLAQRVTSAGVREDRPRYIAARYMKGWFFIDLVACFPVQYIELAVGKEDVNGGEFGTAGTVDSGRLPVMELGGSGAAAAQPSMFQSACRARALESHIRLHIVVPLQLQEAVEVQI